MKITNPEDVYELARRLRQSCSDAGFSEAATQLDDALNVGSSALETLGAIQAALLCHHQLYQEFSALEELNAVTEYVNQIFGRA